MATNSRGKGKTMGTKEKEIVDSISDLVGIIRELISLNQELLAINQSALAAVYDTKIMGDDEDKEPTNYLDGKPV